MQKLWLMEVSNVSSQKGLFHKVAAKIMGTESYNGWTYWHCDINGSTVVIDSLRQKFISETKA